MIAVNFTACSACMFRASSSTISSRIPDEVELGGEMRPLTVMFMDVRGFTALSENMTAGELTTFMNRFLTTMTAAVLEHDGTISHYTGDGLMGFLEFAGQSARSRPPRLSGSA